MARDGDQYVQVKLKTQWGRRKALRLYQQAVRRRNIKIEDLQVEVQRLRALLTEEQLQAFDERYEGEDRTGKRNADRNIRHRVPWEVTPAEKEALEAMLERMRSNGNGNGHTASTPKKAPEVYVSVPE